MSEREFDAYLRLLGGLLKLAPEQREQIAGELRDHMEDRLEALLAAGIPREEAIGQALEEFGDVAALAASFREIAWNRRRKRIMRYTAASVLGVLMVLLTTFALWPQGRSGSLLNQSVAQSQEQTFADTPRQRNAETRKKLQNEIEADLPEVSLSEACLFLGERLGVQVEFDVRGLAEFGIDLEDDPSFGTYIGVYRGQTLLSSLLHHASCGYYLRDGIVVVTSQDEASRQLTSVFYECADLFEHEESSAGPGDLQELISACTGLGGNNGWLAETTGAGTIMRYGDQLIISQTEEVHQEIAYLLQDVRVSLANAVTRNE